MAAREAAGIAVRVEPRVEVLEHVVPDALRAIGCSRVTPGHDDECIQVRVQVARQAFEIGDRAEVCLHDPARSIRQQPVNRPGEHVGLEMHRCRRRQHERAGGRVELAVADAEVVAGIDVAMVEVDRAVMMPGVARRIDEFKRACAKLQAHAVSHQQHAVGRDRQQLAIQLAVHRVAVDGDGAGDELRRIDEVRCAARMQHGPGVRQRLHHLARATRVVEMDVRQEQVIDLLARKAQFVERCQQPGRGRAGPGIDESGASLVHHQVAGREPGAHVLRIDQEEAITQRLGNTACVA